MNGSRQQAGPDGVTPWGGLPRGRRGWVHWMWRVLVPGRRWHP